MDISFLYPIIQYIGKLNYSGMIFFIMLSTFAVIIYNLNKSNNSQFKFEQLLLDAKDNTASISKLAQVIALVTSTWAFITLTLDSKLTEWFFTSYMGMWVLNRGVSQYFGKTSDPAAAKSADTV